MLQIERQRLLEDHHVHALPELRAQQRLAQREPALSRRDAATSRPSRSTSSMTRERCIAARRCDRRDDGIDDQRADVGNAGRQRAGDHREQRDAEA